MESASSHFSCGACLAFAKQKNDKFLIFNERKRKFTTDEADHSDLLKFYSEALSIFIKNSTFIIKNLSTPSVLFCAFRGSNLLTFNLKFNI